MNINIFEINRAGIQSGSHCRRAQIECQQAIPLTLNSDQIAPNNLRVSGKLLSQQDGDGILQVGAAHLENLVETGGTVTEGSLQFPRLTQQTVQFLDGRYVNGTGQSVIGRLTAVDVIQW